MSTDIEKIKHLRDSTGLSLAEIKKAITESGGDESKAMEILKVRGILSADKRSSREVKEGVVESYVHSTQKLGVIVEVLCETDFVARNAEFQKLAHDIAMHIAAMKPRDSKELLEQSFVREPEITIQDLVKQHIAKLGENIQVGQFHILEL